ncbi:MAG: hypothetical protein ACI4IV_03055 [Acutalibacteraceae bacterium]
MRYNKNTRAEKENYYENEKNHQRGACLRPLRADVEEYKNDIYVLQAGVVGIWGE